VGVCQKLISDHSKVEFAQSVKDEYVKEVKAREKELKLKCGQYGIEYVAADIGKDFNQVLLPFLLKRKKMS
jgi:hypothetical protein